MKHKGMYTYLAEMEEKTLSKDTNRNKIISEIIFCLMLLFYTIALICFLR